MMPRVRSLLAASAAAAALALPALAHATATVRVEYVRAAASDAVRGSTANQIGESDGTSQVMTITGTLPAWSNVAPTFGPVKNGFARVTVISGAVDVWRASGTQASAVRVAAGDAPTFIALGSGDSLEFVEDANPPTASGGGGVSGNVGGYSAQVAAAIPVQAATYAVGNSEGGVVALNLARTTGGSGTLTSIRLRSSGGATNTYSVYAWSKHPSSTCSDNVAFVDSPADAPYALPGFPQSVSLTNPGSWDSASYGQISAVNSQFVAQDSPASKTIYFCIVTTSSITPASTSDLSIVAGVLQD